MRACRFLAIWLSQATLVARSSGAKAVAAAVASLTEATGYTLVMEREWRPSDYGLVDVPSPTVLIVLAKAGNDEAGRTLTGFWDNVMAALAPNSRGFATEPFEFLMPRDVYPLHCLGIGSYDVSKEESAISAGSAGKDEHEAPDRNSHEVNDNEAEGAEQPKAKRARQLLLTLGDLVQSAKSRGVLPQAFNLDAAAESKAVSKWLPLLRAHGALTDTTLVNAYALDERAHQLPKRSTLFLPDGKCLTTLSQISTGLPERCSHRARGVLVSFKGRVRKLLLAETLMMKAWPAGLINYSLIADKAPLGPAAHDCVYYQPMVALLAAVCAAASRA